MSVTMGELLAANIIPDIERLSTPKNFAETPVSLTSTQSIYDMPVGSFIQPNELVFASAIGIVEEEEAHIAFIDELHSCRASGLIVAFKNETYRLPQHIIDHAAEKGFSLFTIPWRHRFFDIQLKINNLILYSRERSYRDLQTVLLDLFYDGHSLDEATSAIATQLNSHVCVIDLGGAVLGKSAGSAFPMDREQRVPIVLNNAAIGHLILAAKDSSGSFKPEQLGRFVCFPLSHWFFRRSIEAQTTERLKNDFVWRLANELYASFEEMLYQSRQLQLDLSRGYTCLVFEMQQTDSDSKSGGQINSLNSRQTFVQNLLRKVASEMHLQIMFSSYASQVIIYLEYHKADDLSPEHFVDTVHAALCSRFPEKSTYWGISESLEEAVDFSRLYKHALQALSYSLHSINRRYRSTYHDTKEAQITSLLMHDNSLREDAAAVIEKLTNYSDPSGIDLFGTLRMYMHCNYNVAQTARNLFIHRQSLLYRLGKIEELTGMSLHNHSHLFLLEIYAHVYVGY